MTAVVWIISGTALAFLGAMLLLLGFDGEDWAVYAGWAVEYAAGIVVSVGVIAAGIKVAKF